MRATLPIRIVVQGIIEVGTKRSRAGDIHVDCLGTPDGAQRQRAGNECFLHILFHLVFGLYCGVFESETFVSGHGRLTSGVLKTVGLGV